MARLCDYPYSTDSCTYSEDFTTPEKSERISRFDADMYEQLAYDIYSGT